jgi:CRISPR-associated protein Cas2
MARRRYLVAYDIRDERRLRSVAVCMEGYGTRVQYSVFVCDLSDQERVLMRTDLEARMKLSVDSVMVVDLGQAGDSSRFLFLGHHARIPVSDAVIV